MLWPCEAKRSKAREIIVGGLCPPLSDNLKRKMLQTRKNCYPRSRSTATAGDNIRAGVGEVAAASERVAQGAGELSELSANLQQELAFFTTGDETTSNRNLKALPGGNRRRA